MGRRQAISGFKSKQQEFKLHFQINWKPVTDDNTGVHRRRCKDGATVRVVDERGRLAADVQGIAAVQQ